MSGQKENTKKTESGWLTGRFLIAAPGMEDPRFVRTVVYLCSHGPSGAMGLVVNRLYAELNFPGLLQQLKIEAAGPLPEVPVHFGGPVEPGRGFVLHTTDFNGEGTMAVGDGVHLTATLEILQAIANSAGPSRFLLTLGYAGWGAGQLDAELQTNGWLVAAADEEILFDPINETKWTKSLAKLGISPFKLSADMGHA